MFYLVDTGLVLETWAPRRAAARRTERDEVATANMVCAKRNVVLVGHSNTFILFLHPDSSV